MNKPIRIQRKRTKGFRLQAQSPDGRPVVSVCRPGKWGNPYVVRKIKKENRYIGYAVNCNDGRPIPSIESKDLKLAAKFINELAVMQFKNSLTPEQIQAIKTELVGKHLACFCPLNSPCHADVLLEIANS